jgi:hypothetical protein
MLLKKRKLANPKCLSLAAAFTGMQDFLYQQPFTQKPLSSKPLFVGATALC